MQEQMSLKRLDFDLIQSEILKNVDILVTTLSSSGSLLLQSFLKESGKKVEACIIDEAPQCFEHSCLIPLIHETKKLILIGD